jgi:polyisoprenoid-binding protein YceI
MLLLVASLALAQPASQPVIERSLSEHDGTIYALIFKDPHTLAARSAHDHVVRASLWQGRLRYVPGESSCTISVTFDVNALVPDEPELRARAGLDGTLTDKQRESVKRSMLARDQLAAHAYPFVRFVAERCSQASGTSGVTHASGTLEVRGVKKQVDVTIHFDVSDDTVSASGTFAVKHSDFGFKPYSGPFGAVKNGDDIRVVFEISAQR